MKLYNTLTKRVDEFAPREANKVKMFVCGPTVYDFSHLGHAKTYIQMDILARVLRANEYDVFYLQNITDIDDKIIDRARERGIDWQELRSTFQDEYEKDMKSLGNTSVDQYARATDYIDDIIRQVQTLIDKGHAYTIEGDGIYFEISTFPEYGKLSGRTELKKDDAQTRIDQSDNKRGWNDFALWKFSKPDEPVWAAPFGDGRPGWHIEDTAITEHFFGPQYDIHGGAVDLIFPHHEAEVTQMESASGKSPFVKYWIHTGFLTINDEKMAKSAGNFYTIREVIEQGHDPMAIRLMMLQSHYRSEMNFTYENLAAANNRLGHWRNIAALRHQIHDTINENDDDSESLYAAPHKLREILSNDLATSEGLAFIDDVFSTIEKNPERIHRHSFVELLESLDELLGLELLQSSPDIDDDAKQLIIERERARESGDWKKADRLRDKLVASYSISVKDGVDGTIWQYAD